MSNVNLAEKYSMPYPVVIKDGVVDLACSAKYVPMINLLQNRSSAGTQTEVIYAQELVRFIIYS